MSNEGKILIATLKPGLWAKRVQGLIVEDQPFWYRIKTLGIGELIWVAKEDIKSERISEPPTKPGLPKRFTGDI